MNLVKNTGGASENAKTDEKLVALTLNENSETFARLYDRHYGKIYRIAYGMTGSRELAEDLTQEIFLRAFQKLHLFSGSSSFSTWLHRLAVNCALNYRSRESKNWKYDLIDELAIPSTRDRGAENDAIQKQLQEAIQKALSTLRPELRMVVLFKDMEGLSYEEIAERMDCAVGTVGTWLNRARKQLSRHLANYKGNF